MKQYTYINADGLVCTYDGIFVELQEILQIIESKQLSLYLTSDHFTHREIAQALIKRNEEIRNKEEE